jgi:soluble lytic murein transglycosylase-like protein
MKGVNILRRIITATLVASILLVAPANIANHTDQQTRSDEGNTVVPVYTQYQKTRKADEDKAYEDRIVVASVTRLPYAVANTIVTETEIHHIDLMFVLGVMNLESRFDMSAHNINSNGTTDDGLMQINSLTAPWLAEKIGDKNADVTNPHDNVRMGIWYLSYLNEQCSGDQDCILSKYNGDRSGQYAQAVKDRIIVVASRFGDYRNRK